MEIQTMLKSGENKDLSYIAMQLGEILFLVDHEDTYGAQYVLEQIRQAAQDAFDTFEQPQGIIVFERAE